MRFATIAAFCLLAPGLMRAEDHTPTLEEAQATFAKADRALNDTWTTVKAKLSPADFEALEEKQRDWLTYRDSVAGGAPGEKARGADELDAAAGLTDDPGCSI